MWRGDFNTGRWGQEGVWVGGNRGNAGFSLPGPIYQNYRHYDTSIPLPRRKRAASKMDPPRSSIPKLPEMPNPPRTPAITSSFIAMDDHSLPTLCQTHPCRSVELECRLGSLSLNEILRHQEGHEGQLSFDGILPEDVSRWESEHPGVIENDQVRQEYNFLNQRFIIKCAPTPTHESLSQFFSTTVIRSLVNLGGDEAVDMVRVGSGIGM